MGQKCVRTRELGQTWLWDVLYTPEVPQIYKLALTWDMAGIARHGLKKMSNGAMSGGCVSKFRHLHSPSVSAVKCSPKKPADMVPV